MVEEPSRGSGILNAMTVDVEEHFQVSAFEGLVRREDWDSIPSRVEGNTERLLDLFQAAEVEATFFVLGWVGERYPRLVRHIAERGHEIACHGYDHRLVYGLDPVEFLRTTVLARRILEDTSGREVLGYRAASFSIGRRNLWALDAVAEAGFSYDSSLFPVVHDRYGILGAPRHIHRIRTPGGMMITEVPPSTLSFAGATLPVAGGGYLRIYPTAVNRFAIGRLNRRENMPAVVYVHPWEVDPDQPRIRVPLMTRLRHYTGLRKMAARLEFLMSRFRFGTVERVIEENGECDTFDVNSKRYLSGAES